jgi:hypothetical protein
MRDVQVLSNRLLVEESVSDHDSSVFRVPIPIDIIRALAKLVDRELPEDTDAPPNAVVPDGGLLEV